MEQIILRKATLDVFSGKEPLHMKIDDPIEISDPRVPASATKKGD